MNKKSCFFDINVTIEFLDKIDVCIYNYCQMEEFFFPDITPHFLILQKKIASVICIKEALI